MPGGAPVAVLRGFLFVADGWGRGQVGAGIAAILANAVAI